MYIHKYVYNDEDYLSLQLLGTSYLPGSYLGHGNKAIEGHIFCETLSVEAVDAKTVVGKHGEVDMLSRGPGGAQRRHMRG